MRRRRRLRAPAAAAAALSIALGPTAPDARATEGESDVGAAAMVTFLDARGKGTHLGAGGALFARHGLTDVFDLAGELSLGIAPGVGSQLLGAAAGAHYVVDVARFRPHVGLLAGVTDLWTTSCDRRPSNLPGVTETRPPIFSCGHELAPALTFPLGLEWAPEAPVRVGFASRVVVVPFRDDVPDTLLGIGLGASFAWVFVDEP